MVYTDGVTEAMNPGDELYSSERLLQLVAQTDLSSAEGILETIVGDVERFEAGADRADDLTVLALRRN